MNANNKRRRTATSTNDVPGANPVASWHRANNLVWQASRKLQSSSVCSQLQMGGDPGVQGNAGNVAFRPCHVLYNSSSHRIAKTRNNGNCGCLFCDLQDEPMIEHHRHTNGTFGRRTGVSPSLRDYGGAIGSSAHGERASSQFRTPRADTPIGSEISRTIHYLVDRHCRNWTSIFGLCARLSILFRSLGGRGRPSSQRRCASRHSYPTADETYTGDQPEDREGAWPRGTCDIYL